MRRFSCLAFVTLLSCGSDGTTPPPPPPPPGGDPNLRLVASGLSAVLYVTAPPGDPTRVFTVQQTGQIRVIRHDTLLATPFLDVSSLVSLSLERGLLSLAFHPSYATNGRFYIFYTDVSGSLTVMRYQVSADPNVANASSASLVMSIPHPGSGHNGGLLKFGPDGYLYIGTGDGSVVNDTGQDSTSRLGKILRIDVNGGAPYAVPASNPLVGHPPALPEIWSLGLRNPWRFSFDRANGDLYIGDVGEGDWEEIDYASAATGAGAGRSYGWRTMEGSHCFDPATGCITTGRTLPIYEYSHTSGSPTGCAVIGGNVYRGTRFPALAGRYFFGDLCGGWIRSFRVQGGAMTDLRDHTAQFGTLPNLTSFGEDSQGELYVTAGSAVYRIAP